MIVQVNIFLYYSHVHSRETVLELFPCADDGLYESVLVSATLLKAMQRIVTIMPQDPKEK